MKGSVSLLNKTTLLLGQQLINYSLLSATFKIFNRVYIAINSSLCAHIKTIKKRKLAISYKPGDLPVDLYLSS